MNENTHTPPNNEHEKEGKAEENVQGKPATKQDKWCNVLTLIGLLAVIAVGAHNIFRLPAEEEPTEEVQPAETMEETEDAGEPIDEDLMPPAAQDKPVATDTATNATDEDLYGDSLYLALPDTTHVRNHGEGSENSKAHHNEDHSNAQRQEHSDSTAMHQ